MCGGASQTCGRESLDGSEASVSAITTDHVRRISQLRAVVNEETTHARELILLFRSDLNCEFNVGEIGTGKLKALGGFGLVNVDGMRLGVVASACVNFLKRLRVLLSYIGAEFISIGSHARSIGNAPAAVEPALVHQRVALGWTVTTVLLYLRFGWHQRRYDCVDRLRSLMVLGCG